MSEFNAIRNAIRAERQLVRDGMGVGTNPPPIKAKPTNVVKTAVGREVDISKGYNVRGPDGTKIPFRVDTPLDKAKQWTKNFYNPGEVDVQLNQSFGNRISLKQDENSFIDFQQRKDGVMRVTMSKVTQKGTGVGAGLYKKLFDRATEQGVKVESDRAMSQASVEVWLRFKQMGYPVIEHPRKKMMSGGFENATSPNRPLFEFDPKAKAKMPEPKPDSKPHMDTKLPTKVPEADEADRMIYDLRRAKGVSPEQREKILDVYNDYKMAEDPEVKAQLQSEIRTMIPKSESK